jgi:hypothetical protein
MKSTVFFTLASRNYLAYVLTLMRSLAAQHPDAKRYLCLVDERAGDPALDTPLFEVIPIDQLGLPHFEAFVFRYDIMELNTAVKPYMFEWLRARHPDAGLVYLDPDIFVVRPLSEIAAAFEQGKLAVLTPHLNTALPDDGKFPTELSLMRTGVYNCGFVAINARHPQSAALIAWWSRKLEFGGSVDLEGGLFTDQKWMDMAPGLFPDVEVLRHDGYNLAYWNLASRPVARDGDGTYRAGGVPLVFPHFSGVDLPGQKFSPNTRTVFAPAPSASCARCTTNISAIWLPTNKRCIRASRMRMDILPMARKSRRCCAASTAGISMSIASSRWPIRCGWTGNGSMNPVPSCPRFPGFRSVG